MLEVQEREELSRESSGNALEMEGKGAWSLMRVCQGQARGWAVDSHEVTRDCLIHSLLDSTNV